MSVDQARSVEVNGLYTPYRGFDRAEGPVGTLSIDAEATGDGSGGTMTVRVIMSRIEFGFHPIWVVTRLNTLDGLAAAEAVLMRFAEAGNERLNADFNDAVLAVRQGALNVANMEHLGLVIEPDAVTDANVLIADWATNTNSVGYHLHAYGVLFDAEALARRKAFGKGVDPLLSGIR